MSEMTAAFIDLTGSTGVYEALGNATATEAITRLTHWIGALCEKHTGRVIKYLGDGVMVMFAESGAATNAVTEMERLHNQQLLQTPKELQMRLKVGMARGDVIEQHGDCFGDAVNVAARLCDLAGANQILVTESVIDDLPINTFHRYRSLGSMEIRGRSEACVVFRIEWQDEVASSDLTVAATFDSIGQKASVDGGRMLSLDSMDTSVSFSQDQFPVYLGRDSGAHFVVQDPRVSRLHAKIESRNGLFVISDVSSYGTWVKFSGSDTDIALRRQECVLHDAGEIALGASFDDFSVPTVSFKTTSNR